MSHHKIEVKESEKNPKVLMNNWSLDVLLNKEMGRLGKSEKTVLNRCTMEQKILHKRYKKMMHQSKLSYARITSNHDMEKELRSQTTMRFNTNLGADDHDEMLKRTWDYGRRKRACINDASSSSTSSLSSMSSKPTRAKSAPAKTAAYRTKLKKTHSKKGFVGGAPSSLDSGISLDGLEPLLDDDEDGEVFERPVSVQRATVQQRPATATLAHRQASRKQSLGKTGEKDKQEKDVISRVASANQNSHSRQRKTYAKEAPKICMSGKGPRVVEGADDLDQPDEPKDVRQHTDKDSHPSGQFLETYLAETSRSRPASSKTPKASPEPNSFKEFVNTVVSKEPGGRPNLLDIQKVRVRVANYDSKVKDFKSKVAHLKAPSTAITDYYTTRLLDGPQRKTVPLVTMANPSEKEIRREMGNTKLKSMTFKTLDTEYGQ